MDELMLLTDGSVNTQSNIGYGAYLAVSEHGLSLDSMRTRVKVRRFEHIIAISFISFFEKKFKPIGACSGYKIASLFLPGHFIPAPFFNEISSLP
jgi:hypothetical protein